MVYLFYIQIALPVLKEIILNTCCIHRTEFYSSENCSLYVGALAAAAAAVKV